MTELREYTYHDILTADLRFDRAAIRAVTDRKAAQEHSEFARMGHDRSMRRCRRIALRQVLEFARRQRDAELARRAHAALPVREQLIRSAELQLTIARDGMGMPLDVDKVRRLTAAFEAVKAMPTEHAQAAE